MRSVHPNNCKMRIFLFILCIYPSIAFPTTPSATMTKKITTTQRMLGPNSRNGVSVRLTEPLIQSLSTTSKTTKDGNSKRRDTLLSLTQTTFDVCSCEPCTNPDAVVPMKDKSPSELSSTLSSSVSSKLYIGSSILFLLLGTFVYSKGLFPMIQIPSSKFMISFISTAISSSIPYFPNNNGDGLEQQSNPINLFLKEKAFPIGWDTLQKMVLMEIWRRFWAYSWKAFKETIPRWKTPQWLKERPSLNNFFVRGFRKLFERNIQKKIESIVSYVRRFVGESCKKWLNSFTNPLHLATN